MAHEVVTLVKYKGKDVGRETKVFKHIFEASMKAKGKRSSFADWLLKDDIDSLVVAEDTLQDKVEAKTPAPKAVEVAPTHEDDTEDDLETQLQELEDDEESDDHVDVNSLSYFALKKYAKDQGVEVTKGMKKKELLEELKNLN